MESIFQRACPRKQQAKGRGRASCQVEQGWLCCAGAGMGPHGSNGDQTPRALRKARDFCESNWECLSPLRRTATWGSPNRDASLSSKWESHISFQGHCRDARSYEVEYARGLASPALQSQLIASAFILTLPHSASTCGSFSDHQDGVNIQWLTLRILMKDEGGNLPMIPGAAFWRIHHWVKQRLKGHIC